MKLRLEANSLRLRLRKSEVAALADGQPVSEAVCFGPSTLRYTLLAADVPHITADLHQGTVTVALPTDVAKTWASTDQVGLTHLLPNGQDTVLHILIEKDFPCKDRPDEDKSDTFVELAKEGGGAC